ncbi:CHAT domain-containing protein [Boletus edulis]|nr:CHAT domain-containing protein [Boletus edulis]
MTSRCDTRETRPRSGSETSSVNLAEGCESTRSQQQLELRMLQSSTLADCTSGISDADAEFAGQEQEKQETLTPQERSQPLLSSPSQYATNMDETEGTVITSIRATGVAHGLRRLPAGFYIVVNHSGLEWRTENKQSSVNGDVLEWTGPIIPIPSDLSATVCLEVYASFELDPMLGTGEHLRKLTITAEQLLDRSARDIPFTFFPKSGDIVSPCSSIFVTLQRRKYEGIDSSTSMVLGPHRQTAGSRGELEDATNRGHSALSRYRKHGGKQELERSIAEFERALSICPLDHPCRAAAQSNLAMAKFILCQVEDVDVSLEVPLSLYHDALAARPLGHIDRPSTLTQLAAVHFARFEKRRNNTEGAQAEALLHEVMQLNCTNSCGSRAAAFLLQLHAMRPVHPVQEDGEPILEQISVSGLTHEDPLVLSEQLLHRYQWFGGLAELQQAITLLEKSVGSILFWDPRYSTAVGNNGLALLYRFQHLGEWSDLENAISRLRNALDLTPHGDPSRRCPLSNLGSSLLTRFHRLGELHDLEEAISRHTEGVHLTPDDDPDKPSCLNNLGNSLKARFERLGELSDLGDAISTYRDAVSLTPRDHPDKHSRFLNLGNSHLARFHHLGELNDLEDAISMLTRAVEYTPHGHPHKLIALSSLGNSFMTSFGRLGKLSDLEVAIPTLRDAADLTPHGHPDKHDRLNLFGNSLLARFGRLGKLRDLEDAISTLRHAADLTPQGHPVRPHHLNNLANSLKVRFGHLGELCDIEEAVLIRLGELNDLEEAILMFGNAVNLTPNGHPRKPARLNNLSHALLIRFQYLGQLNDLEDSVSAGRDTVDLTPQGHPDMPIHLNNLGNSFFARFEGLRELKYLEDAISRHRSAVELTPLDHLHKPRYLNDLGNSLLTRSRHLGELSNIEVAITVLRESVDLTPDGHPNKHNRLSNLASSLRVRFERLGELHDLEDAISTIRDAVELVPQGHPTRHIILYNLGASILVRFECLGELSHLEDAISTLREAADLTSHDHPHRPKCLTILGDSLKARFERLGKLCDLQAASSPTGPISFRHRASLHWILCAQYIRHHTLLHAYSCAINLLPQLAWIGLPLAQRYSELKQGATVVRWAAAAALDWGLPELAVEWLEQGRSVVWGELLQLRSSYEELSSVHPGHACRLRELSAALEHAGTYSRNPTQSTVHCTQESLEKEADRHRKLAIERDKLLQDIRRLPGYERFLLPKDFSQLRASAHYRTGLWVLQNSLGALLGDARDMPLDDREGRAATRNRINWESLLSTLFNGVIKPVLDALAFSTVGDLSRIFWCPTGPFVFLPIHAAGLYGTQYSSPGHKVSDFVVSSYYVPTLSILTRSSNSSVPPSDDLRVLVVPQPSSDGQNPLRGVAPELRHIRTVVGNSPSACTTLIQSSVGTVEEVLGLMKDADWVHFACHGVQDPGKPTESGLCLADGRRLKISDIIGLSRSRGGLAFLSACQTAMGDEGLTDEAIHIAAGMLFAGYGGVIGTMWSISDKLAPVVARGVYEYLFRNGTRPDHREAARALHEAVGRLRESGEASFATWLPFIHVGL